MFTGIITDVGVIQNIVRNGDTKFEINTAYDTNKIAIGASISCSGVCLTVIETGKDWFAAEASQETLFCTTAQYWQIGTRINLERALRVGDELGGHWVSGHVDGLGQIISITPEGDSHRLVLRAPHQYAHFIAQKGSITVDGISLTVNHVDGACFGVNIIPHTWAVTTLGSKNIGDMINLEIDLMARYVARQLEAGARGAA